MHSKFRIATLQKKEDIFIYNYDDPIIRKGLKKYIISSKCIPFSIKKELKNGAGAYVKNSKIFIRNQKNEEICFLNIKDIPLLGDHNIYNIMASLIISEIFNINKKSVIPIILKLKPIKHRMENIFHINGVKFFDDSKATNVNAVFYALKHINKPIIWIAGGKDKGNNYVELVHLVKKKVKAIICLGEQNEKIVSFFKEIIDIILETKNIQEAVYMAHILSTSGDNILLSPACSSLDLFKNYKEKGNKFKKEVRKLFYEKKG